jgi:glycosyltransferase involved in cell wall biosynthesis
VVDALIGQGGIGIATYVPDPSNVSYWGDPSKIKRYISAGIPVITTDVFEFSKEILKTKAGIVIAYTRKEFVEAVKTIIHHYTSYQQNAVKLSNTHRYEMIYKKMFE